MSSKFKPSYPGWFTSHPYLPPNASKGDDRTEPLMASAGKVTHTWELLESALQSWFVGAVFTGDAGPLLAFGSVVSSSGRLNMIRSAMLAREMRQEGEPTKTRQLLDKVGKLAGPRNNVAHGTICALERNHFRQVMPKDYHKDGEFFLTPAFYNTSKTRDHIGVRVWYSTATMEEISAAIYNLKLEIDHFLVDSSIAAFPSDLKPPCTA